MQYRDSLGWDSPQPRAPRPRRDVVFTARLAVMIGVFVAIVGLLGVVWVARSGDGQLGAGDVGAYRAARAAFVLDLAAHPDAVDAGSVTSHLHALDAIVAAYERGDALDDRDVARVTETLRADRSTLARAVRAWIATYRPAHPHTATATASDAERELIRASGGMATLEVDGLCDTGHHEWKPLACVQGGSVVHISSTMVRRSDADLYRQEHDTWYPVMTHEYAHVVQNEYRSRLLADPGFRREFADLPVPASYGDVDFPMEASAECMAAVRIPHYLFHYPVTCTPAMLAVAHRIWSGDLAPLKIS